MATEFGSSYPSLFAMTKRNVFYSDKAQINGIFGVPISGAYSYTEERAGFRVRNNPNDARIVCQKDYSDAALCSPKPSSLDFADGVRQDISLFRIYVPAGTTNVRIGVYIPGMVPMAAAAQFGQPPLSGLSSDYYAMSANPLSLKDCITSARMVRSVDGYISVIDDSGLSSDKIYLTVPLRERWLYVKIFDFSGGGYVQTIKYVVTVDYKEYLGWYNHTMDWTALGEEGNISIPQLIPPDTQSSSGTGAGTPTNTPDPFGGSGGSSSLPSSGGSSSSASSTPIITAGMSFADILAAASKPQSTTPTVPVFNQSIPVQKAADITIPTPIAWSQSTVDLKPALNMDRSLLINTQVKVYAAYINPDGKIYIANSNSVFQPYTGGDIPVYLTTTIRSDVWPMSSEGINPFTSLTGTVGQGRSYIFGVTPSNISSSPDQFINNFQGTWFQLVSPSATTTTNCTVMKGPGCP